MIYTTCFGHVLTVCSHHHTLPETNVDVC